MELLSAGAARTVTGSCHLLTLGERRILIDCGLFQGGRALSERNGKPFPFDPASIDAMILTHGHLDHVGRLPKLAREGYSGPVYATRATREVAEVILRDSAKIQFEDHRRALRRARRAGREDEVTPPLYDDTDVDKVMQQFRDIGFDTPLDLAPGIRVTLRPAGHILGSGWIQIDTPDMRLVASGDLGNRESALQEQAAPPPACDVVMIETTYGDRNHRGRAGTEAEFEQVLRAAVARRGKVMIPSFALERTQGVLYQLSRLQASGALPRTPIFLDSPMATKMTDLYRTCANEFRPEVARLLEAGDDPFAPDTLTFTVSTEDSKALNRHQGEAIIVAGSGMMTGGRILHHLKHNLWRPEAALVVVGYQAHGTLGRLLIEGSERVRIFGEEVAVRAEIHTINGFSAHADRDDLLAWLEPTGAARVVMVHGEDRVMDRFADTLRKVGRESVKPDHGVPLTL
jgi:metallo-beta-lactamase family protein